MIDKLGWALVFLLCWSRAIHADDTLSWRSTLEQLREKARAQSWQQTPWHSDLLEARRVAQRENKPIFMWIMNGNPLGRT